MAQSLLTDLPELAGQLVQHPQDRVGPDGAEVLPAGEALERDAGGRGGQVGGADRQRCRWRSGCRVSPARGA